MKYRQWELDRAGTGLLILRFFPILLSKSFMSFSNVMTYKCCTVEKDLLLQHGDYLLSEDTEELSLLIRFCNSKNKPVRSPLITYP